MRYNEIAVFAIAYLFMTYFSEWLGLDVNTAPIVGSALTLFLYHFSDVNIGLMRKEFSENIIKPFLIEVDNQRLIQQVGFNIRSTSELLINVSGGIIPPVLGILAAYNALINYGYPLTSYSILLLFLIIAYNRVTQAIRGRGLGVPLATVLLLTVFASLAMTFHLKDPQVASLITFSASAIASLVGIDILNLKKVTAFKSKYIIVGGMGVADAIFFIPALSSIIVWAIVFCLGAGL